MAQGCFRELKLCHRLYMYGTGAATAHATRHESFQRCNRLQGYPCSTTLHFLQQACPSAVCNCRLPAFSSHGPIPTNLLQLLEFDLLERLKASKAMHTPKACQGPGQSGLKGTIHYDDVIQHHLPSSWCATPPGGSRGIPGLNLRVTA